MRKIAAFIIIFISIYIQAAELEGYMGTPLFSYRVQDNKLPYGEYALIRSYRNTTQMLISLNGKIILYTDRDNVRDSEISVSSYSRLDKIILSEPSITQHEFNISVEKLISGGDANKSSTIPFYGAAEHMDEIKKGLKPAKNDGEFFIFLKENGTNISLMTIDPYYKKLTLRKMVDEKNHPVNFYSVYIDECYDKNIKKIIREYSAVIKKLNEQK